MPLTIPFLLAYTLQALCFLLWALASFELTWDLLLQVLASLAAFPAPPYESAWRWRGRMLLNSARWCFWLFLLGSLLYYLPQAAAHAIFTNCLMYDVFHPQAPWYGCLLP
jgi:hypothetical protein